MNEYHWAKLLQIVGFFMETGVASILLNREFVGSFAEKGLRILSNRRFNIVQRLLMPRDGFPPKLKLQLILSVLIFFAWILLIIAFIFNIDLLFWVSASFLGINTLWMIVDVLLLPITNRPKKYTLGLVMFLLIMRLISVLVLLPIVDTILFCFAYLFFLILKSIAKINLYKFLFALLGFILIIAGLIWEFCLID